MRKGTAMPKNTKKPTEDVPDQGTTEVADRTGESNEAAHSEPTSAAPDVGDEPAEGATEQTEQDESDDKLDDDTTVQQTPVGQRVTRRTIARRTTCEDVEETITEDIALWSPPSVAGYPRPVG